MAVEVAVTVEVEVEVKLAAAVATAALAAAAVAVAAASVVMAVVRSSLPQYVILNSGRADMAVVARRNEPLRPTKAVVGDTNRAERLMTRVRACIIIWFP